jgi:hypothetical protein
MTTTALSRIEFAKLVRAINESAVPPVDFNNRPVRSIEELSGNRIEISTVDQGSSKGDFWCNSTEYVVPADHHIFAEWHERLVPKTFPIARPVDPRLEAYRASLLGTPSRAAQPAAPAIDTQQLTVLVEGLKELVKDPKVRKAAFNLLHEVVNAAERRMEAAAKAEKEAPPAQTEEKAFEELMGKMEQLIESRSAGNNGFRSTTRTAGGVQ